MKIDFDKEKRGGDTMKSLFITSLVMMTRLIIVTIKVTMIFIITLLVSLEYELRRFQ